MKISNVPFIRYLALAMFFTLLLSPIYGEVPLPNPKTYHVSASSGSDQHSGLEKGMAFRTLGAAANLMLAGDNCIIYAGVYRETLVPSNNGRPEAPIAFMAAPGEKVVLSGLDVVSEWQVGEQNIYKATVNWNLGSNLQVFRDGKLLTEARWPNRKTDEFLNREGAKAETEGSSFDRLRCKAFPNEWAAEDLKGATVWCIAQMRWSSWTAPVKSFLKDQNTLLIDGHDTWLVKERHNPGKRPDHGEHHPAEFFISNAKILLDAPGEWYYDPTEGSLSLVVEKGGDPNRSLVEVKRRLLAIDLSNKKHIKVEGLHIIGASVAMKNSENCSLTGLVVEYPLHTRGGFTAMQVPDAEGIFVSGRHNTVAHCEISRSMGSALTVEGTHNTIFNNYIHHANAIAAYCVTVKVNGDHHRIIHNTIAMSGRDGLGIKGKSLLIQYNDIYEAGKICHDTGAIYGGACDGDNSEISYNWIHEVNTYLGAGIYFDAYSSNYNIHNNIIWNTDGASIHLNQPSHYMIVTHNTMYGKIVANYSAWIKGDKTMFGSLLANNLMGAPLDIMSDYLEVSNYLHGVQPSRSEFSPNEISFQLGKGKGIVIPGVSRYSTRSLPDCGAQESGHSIWRAGHDFLNPSRLKFETPIQCYYRNYIYNGCFGEKYDLNRKELSGWTITSGQAKTMYFEGYVGPVEERNSIYGFSLALSGNIMAGVKQGIKGLKEGHNYVLAGYVKNESAQDIIFRVSDAQGEIASSKYSASKDAVWRHVSVSFSVANNSSSISVEIEKCGPGGAYVDIVGLGPGYSNFLP